ncbi:MAG TPA: 3D-(3,5/4)-trihydroxycyclohexane-1,2-dione acylhydrolase (decyclizing) [Vicinamibacterales bacterium]|nr:3D-(3,5/4)-trihydroxycyclohexane-1,2-dione acylhydrolase (decyclizing) [Vicinamibacterales bacterium]
MTPRLVRLTMAQALVRFLTKQRTSRDGREQPLFGGMFGIFGHGNVAGIGQALQEHRDEMPYYLPRNEQAMVHTAAAYAKTHNRLRTLACTSSIGPGATNMITGAAAATINRVPVLLLPGDIFAGRRPAPVLQQLESSSSQDVSVNDCFKPVSRYWDRIERPEQIVTSLPEAMRVLTSPSETGTVTLALPQDVQAEAYDYPAALFEPRVWTVPRARADRDRLQEAAALVRASRRPMIIAGGGAIYSEATPALRAFVDGTGIPVGETQAGKGALPEPHPLVVGGVGATGTRAANVLARDADLVIVVGSRLSDFTTASKTAFQHEHVRFVAINVAEIDAHKHAAMPLIGDARVVLEELGELVAGYHVGTDYTETIGHLTAEWRAEVERVCAPARPALPARPGLPARPAPAAPPAPPALTQAEVIGVLQSVLTPNDTIVCAAGSLPGDLHKLWRARDPKAYHLEYGYSCMGYEIAGGLGVKMAAPERGVYVLVGDGSYLMMAQEIATAVQERVAITIVVFDNQGFASIGGLSASVGCAGFGTRYRSRNHLTGELDGDVLSIDFASNAASLGAHACCVDTLEALRSALAAAKKEPGPSVIVVPIDRDAKVGGYESWWDVPVAAVSTMDDVRQARAAFEAARLRERDFL